MSENNSKDKVSQGSAQSTKSGTNKMTEFSDVSDSSLRKSTNSISSAVFLLKDEDEDRGSIGNTNENAFNEEEKKLGSFVVRSPSISPTPSKIEEPHVSTFTISSNGKERFFPTQKGEHYHRASSPATNYQHKGGNQQWKQRKGLKGNGFNNQFVNQFGMGGNQFTISQNNNFPMQNQFQMGQNMMNFDNSMMHVNSVNVQNPVNDVHSLNANPMWKVDWNCMSCGHYNKGANICKNRMCGAQKPVSQLQQMMQVLQPVSQFSSFENQEWWGGEQQNYLAQQQANHLSNPSWSTQNTSTPQSTVSTKAKKAQKYKPKSKRQWICHACGNKNFPNRKVCNMRICNAARTSIKRDSGRRDSANASEGSYPNTNSSVNSVEGKDVSIA